MRNRHKNKAHIVNLSKSIPTLIKEAHLHINSKWVGASDIDAGNAL